MSYFKDWKPEIIICHTGINDCKPSVLSEIQNNFLSRNPYLFKYLNFFIETINRFFFEVGFSNIDWIEVALPIGISFYTFQTLSYTIDVYNKKLNPTTDFVSFAAFVSFFPQLVAGPIERATNLIPQFLSNRKFSYPEASSGMRQILWGLFKKVVIADSLSLLVNPIFDNYEIFITKKVL